QRHATDLAGSNPRTEVVYALSSQPTLAAGPARLDALVHAHWAGGALHWVRDVVFAQDASRIRTASGPQVMATLRNLAVGLLRLAGHTASPPRCAGSAAVPPAPWRSSASHEYQRAPQPDQPEALAPRARPISRLFLV